MPTWLNALLQLIIKQFFTRARYAAGSKFDLRIDHTWEPKPDVAGSLVIEDLYPTKPIDIAANILSPPTS